MRQRAARDWAAHDWASVLAAAVGFATVIAYLVIVANQETDRGDYPRVGFVTLYFAALSAAALASVSASGRRCITMRTAATAGFLFWGLIAAASIGLPLLIAGLMALVALIRTLRVVPGSLWWASMVAVVTVLVGVAGIVLTASLSS